MAAERGNRSAALLLLEKGADINAKDNKGKTPLDYVRTEEFKKFFEEYGQKN
ncbi:MAG: ankyrin repeat domain-containing protein [Candidatus Eremiobacterota bacterium]